MDKGNGRSALLIGGTALIAVAVAIFLLQGEEEAGTSCSMAAGGVLAISEGLNRGHSAARIIAAGTVPFACDEAVETFIEEPTADTEIAIKGSTGEIERSTSGLELTSEAPQPSSEYEPQRIVDCFVSYRESNFLYRLCLDEVVHPG